MANGRALEDEAFTAASWDYPLAQVVKVTIPQGRMVRVRITDRGPAKRLYRHGRILHLSQAAFQALAPLSQGVIEIEVTPQED